MFRTHLIWRFMFQLHLTLCHFYFQYQQVQLEKRGHFSPRSEKSKTSEKSGYFSPEFWKKWTHFSKKIDKIWKKVGNFRQNLRFSGKKKKNFKFSLFMEKGGNLSHSIDFFNHMHTIRLSDTRILYLLAVIWRFFPVLRKDQHAHPSPSLIKVYHYFEGRGK